MSQRIQGVSQSDVKTGQMSIKKDSVVSLLLEISEKQKQLLKQQEQFQQQLEVCHQVLQQPHNFHQQVETLHGNLCGRIFTMETSLNSLHQSLSECVKESVRFESLKIQEKVAMMEESVLNEMLEEMQDTANGISQQVFKPDKKIFEFETSVRDTAEITTIPESRDCLSLISGDKYDDEADGVDNAAVFCSQSNKDFAAFRKVSKLPFMSHSEAEGPLKQVLHNELTFLLVNIQELLLKPVTSANLIFQFTDTIHKLLLQERNASTDHLQSVQKAVNTNANAQIHKMEKFIRQTIKKIRSFLEHSKPVKLDAVKICKEISNLKDVLSCEHLARIISELNQSSFPETNQHSFEMGNEEMGQSKLRVIKHDGDQEPQLICQLKGYNLIGSTCDPVVANGNGMFICSEKDSAEQMNAVMLMLSLHVLTLLLYSDVFGNKQPLKGSTGNADTTNTQQNASVGAGLTCNPFELNTASTESSISSANINYDPVLQNTMNATRDITHNQRELLHGQKEEVQFICDLYYNKFLHTEEITMFELKDIFPGYNLELKATFLANKTHTLNLYLLSVCGEHDKQLVWPAEFSLTITLEDRKHSAKQRQNTCQRFVKTLRQPNEHTGRSSPTYVCYFREDVIKNFVDEDTLHLTVSVMYTGNLPSSKTTAAA